MSVLDLRLWKNIMICGNVNVSSYRDSSAIETYQAFNKGNLCGISGFGHQNGFDGQNPLKCYIMRSNFINGYSKLEIRLLTSTTTT